MNKIEDIIQSGLLEMYVLGICSEQEQDEIERLSANHAEIREEIEQISDAVLKFSGDNQENLPKLNTGIKPFLMAMVDYTERRKAGEPETIVPSLNKESKAEDFSQWLDNKTWVRDHSMGDTFAKIIAHTKDQTTAVVWLDKGAQEETHFKEHEKFLIVEGTCDINTLARNYSLVAGDFFEVPLYLPHAVVVTSRTPCKLILQRSVA
jgi:mannose-6-phosphate isomerase-like protein (cupin superfamily)